MASVNSQFNTASRNGSDCDADICFDLPWSSQKPRLCADPTYSGFLFEVDMKRLTAVFPVRLTDEDYNLLHSLAKELGVKPGQIARYGIRKVLSSGVKDGVSLQERG